jgi:hypothetical protein
MSKDNNLVAVMVPRKNVEAIRDAAHSPDTYDIRVGDAWVLACKRALRPSAPTGMTTEDVRLCEQNEHQGRRVAKWIDYVKRYGWEVE